MPPSDAGEVLVSLCRRAHEFLLPGEVVDDLAMATYVYGSRPPTALLEHLLRPLRADPTLARAADGTWHLASPATADGLLVGEKWAAWTTLAVVATGGRPSSARVVGLAAVHVADGVVVESLSLRFRPETRVRIPRFAAERLGVEQEWLEDEDTFAAQMDVLCEFLADRAVVAQEARLAWAFLEAEARRADRTLPRVPLVDLTSWAAAHLPLLRKPTLSAIAAHLGAAGPDALTMDDEARLLARLLPRLQTLWGGEAMGEAALALAPAEAEESMQALKGGEIEGERAWSVGRRPLSQSSPSRPSVCSEGNEARLKVAEQRSPAAEDCYADGSGLAELPDAAGVYVLRDAAGEAAYVGKSRRLRERVASYSGRPIGPTRRLEGLADAVRSIEVQVCANELEASIEEDRRIRALRPRFNTQRERGRYALWVCLPPLPVRKKGRRAPAPRRLLVRDSEEGSAAQYVGPYRGKEAAQRACKLAREVFDLDAARLGGDRDAYEERLQAAWSFLQGHAEDAVARARARLGAAVADRDERGVRCWRGVLRAVLRYDPSSNWLPADPRLSRYLVIRPERGDAGVEVYLLDRARLVGYEVFEEEIDPDVGGAWIEGAISGEPRTSAEEAPLALRWLSGLRADARLLLVGEDVRVAGQALSAAVAEVQAEQREKVLAARLQWATAEQGEEEWAVDPWGAVANREERWGQSGNVEAWIGNEGEGERSVLAWLSRQSGRSSAGRSGDEDRAGE